MTLLLFVLGIGLVAATARILVYAVVLPRLRLASHLRQIDAYGFEHVDAAEVSVDRPRFSEAVARQAERIGQFMVRTFPMLTPISRGELSAAAIYDVSTETVHGYRAMLALVLPTLVFLFALLNGGLSMIAMLVAIGAGVAGWLLPAQVIRGRGRKRLDEIDRTLPDLIDLLTSTIEAGMGFAASIQMVSGRFKGALGDELRLTQQQQKLGTSTDRALRDMVERCDTPSMRAFVRTLRTAETMGVSIGTSMRELAQDVRRRRRQTARERMQKAPVKLLFPLMVFIFPALMIELMYPAAVTLLHTLSAGG